MFNTARTAYVQLLASDGERKLFAGTEERSKKKKKNPLPARFSSSFSYRRVRGSRKAVCIKYVTCIDARARLCRIIVLYCLTRIPRPLDGTGNGLLRGKKAVFSH